MYKYRRKGKAKPNPKIKQDKQIAEYYENYTKLPIDKLLKKHEKDKSLIDKLEEQIAVITPNYRLFLNADVNRLNTQSEINSLNGNQRLIQETVDKHNQYSQKGFVAKMFSSPPNSSLEALKNSLQENTLKIKNLKLKLQKLELDIKACPVRFEDRIYSVTELEKLEKSTNNRLSNAEIRVEAQVKAIEVIRSNEAAIRKREDQAASREKNAELKVDHYKAYAAAYFDQTRKLGAIIRKRLLEQEDFLIGCPYCGNAMGEIPHADHIYPVSKGGLSTIKNMVLVCSACNIRKSDYTLREFIKRCSLDRNFVEKNLEILKKTY
jgi:5-methylcytosine-specific restriction endonuclease McrA